MLGRTNASGGKLPTPEEIGAATPPTLLWENASPTSAFQGDSWITELDLRPYSQLKLEYRFSTDYDQHYSIVVPCEEKPTYMHMFLVSKANKTGYRSVSAYHGGVGVNGTVSFGIATYNDANNEKYAIPTRIWGIKGG